MIYTHTLSNGIRIVHNEIVSEISYCAVIINTGTRDETPSQHGLAHFTEHLLFKGTKKRKAFQILNRMENIGAYVDAFTTKEETCVNVAFLNQYYERAVEFLNDIVFNSEFPEKELIKERDVVIDEINSYKDNPAELIFDEFENYLYPNHELGFNILGNSKNLKKYNSEDIKKFVSQKYNTDQIVFCSIGNINFKKLLRLCEKYFQENPINNRDFKRTKFDNNINFYKKVNKHTHQSHCIMGNYSYSNKDNKRLPLLLLSNYLGGASMNAKLVTLLREKRGLCYNIETNVNPYEDTGNFSVYFGVDKDNTDNVIEIILRELNYYKHNLISDNIISIIKKQSLGQLMLLNSSHSNNLISFGKSILTYGSVESIEDTIKEINSIKAENLREVANEIFDTDKFSYLIYY